MKMMKIVTVIDAHSFYYNCSVLYQKWKIVRRSILDRDYVLKFMS